MAVNIRQAGPDDAGVVTSVLHEAAGWLEARGIPLWRTDELLPDTIASEVHAGLFWIADVNGEPAGAVRIQDADPGFWPDVPAGESTFVHRLAVRRMFAGGELSSALLAFVVSRTRELDRRYVRLDCEAQRPKLRAIYERFGFQHHSDRHVGPYFVARYVLDVGAGPGSEKLEARRK